MMDHTRKSETSQQLENISQSPSGGYVDESIMREDTPTPFTVVLYPKGTQPQITTKVPAIDDDEPSDQRPFLPSQSRR